ncbi:hypothetical protein ACWENR_18130 [Micromonospora sp. NPDC004336]
MLALAAAAGVAMTLLVPTAASAAYYGDETDYGTVVSGVPYNGIDPVECRQIEGARGCFISYGDRLYVKDMVADGYAAALDWVDLDGPRWGSCVNKQGAGTWVLCNKDLPEGHDLNFRVARYDSGNRVDDGPWWHWIA